MIKTFGHRGIEKLFFDGVAKGIQPKHLRKVTDILDQLDSAAHVGDMNFPGSSLHPLKGKLKGYWSVRVSGNWRIVFRFADGDVYDVDYIDYH